MNSIKDHENLGSKRVLLRLDLNVPLRNGDITAVSYTQLTLPTKA